MATINTVGTGQYLMHSLCNHPDRKKTEEIKKIHSDEDREICYKSMLLRHKKGHVLLPIRFNYRN